MGSLAAPGGQPRRAAPTKSNTFAIIHTWPDLKNAEYEVLQRVLQAAERVGASTVVIDRNGRILWSSPDLDFPEGGMLDPDEVAFVLALHFESGRVLDAYAYITLWQPIEFYHVFGYQKSIDKLTSYSDLLSCASDLADAHGINLLTGLGRPPLTPLPRMFHTLPEPFLEPKISATSRLFYIGINWERIGRPKGRFHDAMVLLDEKELTDIYGPEKIMGVAPWEGFKTYRGELPFDGNAVKNAINNSGICLVLSSAAHKAAGIMSNRLFEGLAGGSAIIATPNALIDKYFLDVVYLVDDTRGEDHLYQQIVEKMRYIRAHPEEAARKARAGQAILRQTCSIEKSILSLLADHPQRLAHFEDVFLAQSVVSVILTFEPEDVDLFKRHVRQFTIQRRARVTLHVVCDRRFAAVHGSELTALATGSLTSIVLHPMRMRASASVFDGMRANRDRTGPTIAAVLKQIDTPFFAFSTLDDMVLSDHFASVARLFEQQPLAAFAASGMISRRVNSDRTESREIDGLRFVDLESISLVNGRGQVGRFVYRTSLLDAPFDSLMQILDGEEHSYFRLAALLNGPLAQTNYCSYVSREVPLTHVLDRIEPVEYQRQYIRDLFARDSRWLDKLSKGGKIPEFVYAYGPGSPIPWQNYASPAGIKQIIPIDAQQSTCEGGDGLTYLSSGFSYPEADGTWVAGERGIVEFALPLGDPHRSVDYEIVLGANGRRAVETGREQHVSVAVNGMMVSYQNVPEERHDVRFRIPRSLLKGDRSVRLELIPDHTEKVYDPAGQVTDERRLSVRIVSIAVQQIVAVHPVRFDVGRRYATVRGERGATALVNGFHAFEGDRTWMAGTQGDVLFDLDREPKAGRLHLVVQGRRSVANGDAQMLSVAVNHVDLGRHELADGDTTLSLDLASVDLSLRRVDVRLVASHAEAVYNEKHQIVDNRLLGIAIREVGVEEAQGVPTPVDGEGSSTDTVPSSSTKAMRLLGRRK